MTKNLDTAAKNLKADLRTAYLLGFDNFSTEPVEVGNAVNGNSRYGRELLAVLVNKAGLMTTTFVNGSDEVWQCLDTYDNTDRKTAETTIDTWLEANMGETETTKDKALHVKKAVKNANPAGLPNCFCGCGAVTNRNRNYRPGHDARHAGNVGRAYAASGDKDLLLALPTAALRAKATQVAIKAQGRKAKPAKAAPKAAPQPTVGTIKIGRWTYPAVKIDDMVTYETKTARKVADTAQALRFVAGE